MKTYKLTLLGIVAFAMLAVAPLHARTETTAEGPTRTTTHANTSGGSRTSHSGVDRWRHRRHRTYSNFYFGSGFGYGYPYGYGSPFGYGYGGSGYGYGGYPYGYSRFGSPYGYGYGYDSGYGNGYNNYSRPVVRGDIVGRNGSVGIQVQQRLAREGFYNGRIDGVIGTGTRRAIRSFERAHGLPVDGRIDTRLLVTMGLA